MAGIAALLNQKMAAAQGNLNPRLYQLAANTSAAAFHDVTVASSHVSGCTLAVPSLCNNTTPGPSGLSGGPSGYLVGNGYDLATGLGSVDAANFVAHWRACILAQRMITFFGNTAGSIMKITTSGTKPSTAIGMPCNGRRATINLTRDWPNPCGLPDGKRNFASRWTS